MTAMEYVPLVVLFVVTVNVETGEFELTEGLHEGCGIPALDAVQDSVTVPLYPPQGLSVIVDLADAPGKTVEGVSGVTDNV